jgi:hypothetical protein
MAQETIQEETSSVVLDAIAADKREGLRLAVKARWIALAVIAVFLVYLTPRWEVIYYESLILGFAAIGWAQLKLGRVGSSRPELFLMFCDLALMTFTLVVPNPLYESPWPLAMQYRFDNFMYFYILLASGALTYSWRTIIAMGYGPRGCGPRPWSGWFYSRLPGPSYRSWSARPWAVIRASSNLSIPTWFTFLAKCKTSWSSSLSPRP